MNFGPISAVSGAWNLKAGRLGCAFLALLEPSFWPSFLRINGAEIGILLGAAIGLCCLAIARQLSRKAIEEKKRALELAEFREHERDMAQKELVRRLEEERELAKARMQFESQLADYEKYASLAQLALGAAHEINNPLLGILSHLELELKAATRAEVREELEQCIEGAKRISSAVRGLLNYARPGPLLLSHVHLHRLVEETVNFVAHQPMFRAITLENKVPPALPAITADSNQISQVLMNLLLNAAQATPPGGKVTISAEKVMLNDKVELRIVDTGIGIPADILPHVFEPFFTTKRTQGTGLGLSISQAYVRNHEGSIHVESIPNQGTTVRVVLPIRQEGRAVMDEEVVV